MYLSRFIEEIRDIVQQTKTIIKFNNIFSHIICCLGMQRFNNIYK